MTTKPSPNTRPHAFRTTVLTIEPLYRRLAERVKSASPDPLHPTRPGKDFTAQKFTVFKQYLEYAIDLFFPDMPLVPNPKDIDPFPGRWPVPRNGAHLQSVKIYISLLHWKKLIIAAGAANVPLSALFTATLVNAMPTIFSDAQLRDFNLLPYHGRGSERDGFFTFDTKPPITSLAHDSLSSSHAAQLKEFPSFQSTVREKIRISEHTFLALQSALSKPLPYKQFFYYGNALRAIVAKQAVFPPHDDRLTPEENNARALRSISHIQDALAAETQKMNASPNSTTRIQRFLPADVSQFVTDAVTLINADALPSQRGITRANTLGALIGAALADEIFLDFPTHLAPEITPLHIQAN